MPAPLAIASYFTIWWVALFAVFPIVSRAGSIEGDGEAPPGIDLGAPRAPRFLQTVVWTTVVAAVLFAALDATVIWLG
jgi:predicted secreted protein